MAVAEQPLNPQAVKAANEKVWRDNPDLAGRPLTMDSSDTAYRKQWMTAYNKALADMKATPATSGGKTGAPARACPAASLADLSVRVTRINDGAPLDGVRVQISGAESRTAVTDSTGAAVFRGICPGAYEVHGSKPDYSAQKTSVTVAPGGKSNAALFLASSVQLVVRVVDESGGAPIAAASLRLTGPSSQSARTDATGHALFFGIAAGSYRIEASAMGYKAGSVSQTVNAGASVATVSLSVAAGLVGRVFDSNDHSPIAGATVTLDKAASLSLSPQSPASDPMKTAVTDADGNFDFGEVEAGRYRVVAEKNGNRSSAVAQVTKRSSTYTEVVIDTITVTSVKIAINPRKIIHSYDETVAFIAIVEPTPPDNLVYRWYVDGVPDTSQTDNLYVRKFRPAATRADRRRDYRVEVRVTSKTATRVIRVAQNVNVGTPNVAKSNAGMDTYGWTDTSPEQFDVTLTDKDDQETQTSQSLTRQCRSKTLEDGTTQYGRLQYVSGSGDPQMVTYGWFYRSAAIVYCRDSAYLWDKEEFDSMMGHERQHCKHRTASADLTSIWKKLMDGGHGTVFSPFTEMLAYFSNVQDPSVSYKWFIEDHTIQSFIREYNNAKAVLATLSGDTKAQARALIQSCFDDVKFGELREAASEGWDHHIDAP